MKELEIGRISYLKATEVLFGRTWDKLCSKPFSTPEAKYWTEFAIQSD